MPRDTLLKWLTSLHTMHQNENGGSICADSDISCSGVNCADCPLSGEELNNHLVEVMSYIEAQEKRQTQDR